MKGKTVPRSVVTSGRLTGPVKGNRVIRRSGAAASCEAAYSLYSTDSEDQVPALHRDLDRCAALLSDMLSADGAASTTPPRTVKGAAAAKSRISASRGKKINHKPAPNSGQRGSNLAQTGRLATTPRTPTTPRTTRFPPTLVHSGVKLPPSQRKVLRPVPNPPGTSPYRPRPSADGAPKNCDPEEELVPVRDTGTSSNMKLQPEENQDIASLQIQNTQLRRRVRVLNQQLQERERAEKDQNVLTLSHSQILNVEEELVTAQSRLQELQADLVELQRALQDTRGALREREAENMMIKSELEAVKQKLEESERAKERLTLGTQHTLEETDTANRFRQGLRTDDLPPVMTAAPPTERITHYLLSLPKTASTLAQQHTSQLTEEPLSGPCDPDHCTTLSLSETLSSCSLASESTFNTRDEVAFKDGLAALDASIASLQRTIKLDLKR